MNNYIKSATKIIFSLAFLSTLYACDNNGAAVSNTTNVAQTEIPAALQKLTVGAGTLTAFVMIDGNTAGRTEMTLDYTDPNGTATATIPSLTLEIHTVTITYEYTDGGGTLVVASATNTVDMTSGSNSIAFAAGDYDLASYDEDGDGSSNAAEVAAGTDPRVAGVAGLPSCVLGTSTLDGCTL